MHKMTGKLGVLIPIGGAEDRGEETAPKLPFSSKGVLKHVLGQANGQDSRVVFVTTASKIPDELKKLYGDGFAKLGCKRFEHFHLDDKEMCEDPAILRSFAEADVVFFSGGNQARLPRYIRNTTLHELLSERYENDSLVIAGTSAGAMAMSKHMIAGGSASEAFYKGAVRLKRGFSFIPSLVIDTHFVRRGRFGRLAEAVAKHPRCIGIGLAEDTGVIIRNGNEFRVIGSGMVIVMDPREVTHNNHAVLDEGTLLSMTNLTTHFLSNGDRFSIDAHTVEVLKIGEAYI